MNKAGANAGRNASRCALLRQKLQRIEFAIADLVLYLDAYPNCRAALEYYHRLIDERKETIAEMNSTCGPITYYDNESRDCWEWVDGPWPWQIDAN